MCFLCGAASPLGGHECRKGRACRGRVARWQLQHLPHPVSFIFSNHTLSPLLMNSLFLCPCGSFHGWPFRGAPVCACARVYARVCVCRISGSPGVLTNHTPRERLQRSWKPRVALTHALGVGRLVLMKGPTVNSPWLPDGNGVSQGKTAPASSWHSLNFRHSLCIYSNWHWVWGPAIPDPQACRLRAPSLLERVSGPQMEVLTSFLSFLTDLRVSCFV